MTTFADPHESRALAALAPLRVVPGRPRKPQPDPGPVEVPVLAPPDNRDRATLTDAATDPDADLAATEHRVRCAVAARLADDPAAAVEVLQALGLVDEARRPVSVGRVGELHRGIRD